MNIVLDNIIFSLQKSGGITVVWKEFLTRLCVIPKLNIYLINYTNSNVSIRFCGENINEILRKAFFFRLKRYINPRIPLKEQFIFHVRNTEYIFIGIPTAAKKQHNGICADVLF